MSPTDRSDAREETPSNCASRTLVLLVTVLFLLVLDSRVWGGLQPPLIHLPVGLSLAVFVWFGRTGLFLLVASAPALLLAVALRSLSATEAIAALAGSLLTTAQAALGWYLYRDRLGGSRWLTDPHSAILFFLLFAGPVAGVFAAAQAAVQVPLEPAESFLFLWLDWWLADALGFFVLGVPLLVLNAAEPTPGVPLSVLSGQGDRVEPLESAPVTGLGDWLEMAGLALAAGLLSLLLIVATPNHAEGLPQWAVTLLPATWACLRQGLRGGMIAAGAAALLPLLVLAGEPSDANLRQLQGGLLAQCGVVLLIGASFTWIRTTEERYRQVVDRVPALLYSARLLTPATGPLAGGRTTSAPALLAEVTLLSPATAALFGCAPDQLRGDHQRWLDRVHPEDRELVQAARMQLTRQRPSPSNARDPAVICEYRVAPDVEPLEQSGPSTPRWVRDSMSPRFDRSGRLIGWDGVVTDITEQRRLADDLRRTSSMFQVLVTNLPAGVFFIQGSTGRPLLVNARARQLLGQRENGFPGLEHLSTMYRLYRADQTPYPVEELPVYQALKYGRTTMRDDIIVHRPDGQWVPLISWAAPVRLTGPGKEDGAVWVLEDLTALHQAEARYRELVDHLPLMLVQCDTQLRLEYANPAMTAITGYRPEEIRDPAAWMRAIHPADLPRVQASLARALAGETVRYELRYQGRDGSEKIGFGMAQPLRQGGRIVGVTCVVLDLTRERQLERELQHEQRLELIGRVASGVAHDFNNLLTVILNLCAVSQVELAHDHPTRKYLDLITEACERAAGLAGQLLNFSRQRVQLRTIDLNQIAIRTLDLVRALLPGSITPSLEISPETVPVWADETQVQQVLLNLCLNARDAMPQGGRLRVSVRHAPCPDKATPCGSLVVEDDGEGMSEEVRQNLFRPFFTTKDEGHGLGLAVVQQIVESYHGRIVVTSEPGRGTRFEVFLPQTQGLSSDS